MKLLKLHESQYTVHAVCDERGEAQLLEFLEGLGANYSSSRNGMLNPLERCAEHGPPGNAELKHRLDDGIYELIKGQLRVVFFTDAGKLIICSHGFLKKSRKVPRREIEAAKQARLRYQQARQANRLQILEDSDDDQ